MKHSHIHYPKGSWFIPAAVRYFLKSLSRPNFIATKIWKHLYPGSIKIYLQILDCSFPIFQPPCHVDTSSSSALMVYKEQKKPPIFWAHNASDREARYLTLVHTNHLHFISFCLLSISLSSPWSIPRFNSQKCHRLPPNLASLLFKGISKASLFPEKLF